jgi:ParB family chromosome partitioning protein
VTVVGDVVEMSREDRLNAQARAEGWSSRGQKYRAAKAGVTDPAVWAARQRAADLTTTGAGQVIDLPTPAEVPLPLEGGDITPVVMLPIDDLHPSPDNPRHLVAVDDLMVQSIHAVGILAPLLVVPRPTDGWEIIAGHRRWINAKAAGLERVPCTVRHAGLTDVEKVELMLVENLQRRDLDPLDEAVGFTRLMELGLTQRQIADRVGRNQSHVSRRIRLLDLDDTLVPHLRDGRMPLRVAEELAVAGREVQHAAIGWLAKHPNPEPDATVFEQLLRKADEIVRQAQARQEGKASGLTEWTGNTWELLTTPKETATHWYVRTFGSFEVVYGVPRTSVEQVHERAAEDRAAEAAERAARREAEEAARHARDQRLADLRAFHARHLDELFDTAVRMATLGLLDWSLELPPDSAGHVLRMVGHPTGSFGPDELTEILADLVATTSTSGPRSQQRRLFTAVVAESVTFGIVHRRPTTDVAGWLTDLVTLGWEPNADETALLDEQQHRTDGDDQ